MNLIFPACEVWMCDVVKLSDKERESCESVCSAVTGCKKVWKHFKSFQLPKETDVIAEFFSSKTLQLIKCFFFCCRLFETLQSLFWSIFGLISLYVTNVDADHQFTEFVGATMFGTYNIISLVVLLNMLIAMMNNSYQHIAVSTDQTYYRHDMCGVYDACVVQCVSFALISVAGSRRHRVEVCPDKAVDELLWRRGHSAGSVQHHPQPQIILVPHLLDQEAGVQEEDELQAVWNYWISRSKWFGKCLKIFVVIR